MWYRGNSGVYEVASPSNLELVPELLATTTNTIDAGTMFVGVSEQTLPSSTLGNIYDMANIESIPFIYSSYILRIEVAIRNFIPYLSTSAYNSVLRITGTFEIQLSLINNNSDTIVDAKMSLFRIFGDRRFIIPKTNDQYCVNSGDIMIYTNSAGRGYSTHSGITLTVSIYGIGKYNIP